MRRWVSTTSSCRVWASILVLPDLNWTDLDASGGHCAARQRGSWVAFVNPLMARRQLCDHVRAKGIQARMLYNWNLKFDIVCFSGHRGNRSAGCIRKSHKHLGVMTVGCNSLITGNVRDDAKYEGVFGLLFDFRVLSRAL